MIPSLHRLIHPFAKIKPEKGYIFTNDFKPGSKYDSICLNGIYYSKAEIIDVFNAYFHRTYISFSYSEYGIKKYTTILQDRNAQVWVCK